MVGFLFWVIGSCFFLGGLFCLLVGVSGFLMLLQGVKKASFAKSLLWFCAGVVAEGLMVVFYTCKP